jgi:LmbE family N-acetylglucosaminyl deacetylase
MREYLRRFYRTLLPFLYSRKKYRLFLSTSFEALSGRSRELATVTEYFLGNVRPIPISAPFGNSMLVLAPHQDDEIIGCGGVLALQQRAGAKTCTVVLQDGADAHAALGVSRRALNEIRNRESCNAARALGVSEPIFFDYSDLLASRADAAARLRALILDRKVDAIFAPFVLDKHPDHRATNEILATALADLRRSIRVFGYEVWGLAVANVLAVIDSVIEEKMQSLACFEFANSAADYSHSTKGLNMYRSRLLGAGQCKYAECFFEIPSEEFVRLIQVLSSSSSEVT